MKVGPDYSVSEIALETAILHCEEFCLRLHTVYFI